MTGNNQDSFSYSLIEAFSKQGCPATLWCKLRLEKHPFVS